ncbi:MAG: PepSY domain-containing protein [Clostridia bacterium]|nr:PepSY domain-containing protein [Clostridia bacterium]
MFEKIIITLILVLAAVLVFSGCTKLDRMEDKIENHVDRIEDAIESKVDPIEDAIESKADAVEDAIEDAILGNPTHAAPTGDAVTPTSVPAQDPIIPAEPTPVTNPAQESIDKVADLLGDILKEQASGVTVPDSVVDSGVSSSLEQPVFITPEEAKRIALDHAGVSAEDAVFDRTERDYDNGIYHYEIEFRVGFTEYEYDIHAETGEILSFEKDR